jgi:AraC-like DNA-binding protein
VISSICAVRGQSPELELRLGVLIRSLLSVAAGTLRKAYHKIPATADRESLERFMLERLDGTVTIHMISTAFAINETAVKGLFRSLFNNTVHGYLLEQRLTLAARLLQTTRDPVYAIALRTGFTDGSHFIKRFRERFGVTPEAYRKDE